MGRAPCCDKAKVKRGPWSPDEDDALKSYIHKHGTGGNWIALPHKIGLKRCGKSCRLRWLNYLRPNIKHGGFTEDEDNLICSLYISIGSRWSIIAGQLPGRTDNDIKNYWNTRLRKKLLGRQRRELRVTKNIIRGPPQNHQNCTLVHEYSPDFSLYPPLSPPPNMVAPSFIKTAEGHGEAPDHLTNNISFISPLNEPVFSCYDHSQIRNNVGESLCYSPIDQTVDQQLEGSDFQGVNCGPPITTNYVPGFDEITDGVIMADRWSGDIGCLVYPCADVYQNTVMRVKVTPNE